MTDPRTNRPTPRSVETSRSKADRRRRPWAVRTRLKGESGLTLVELSVAMMITALLSTVMVAWMTAGVNSERAHRSYDAALSDLRQITDQLSREIRGSDGLTAASEHSVSFWLDTNRDGVTETGEIVTWTIDESNMVRSTNGGTEGILATTLSPGDSGFSYDSDVPSAVTRVTITLGSLAYNGSGNELLQRSVDIYLRNK